MAWWTFGLLIGPVIGPILGGYLTEEYGWRWIFLVNIPIGIVGLIGSYLYIYVPFLQPMHGSPSDYRRWNINGLIEDLNSINFKVIDFGIGAGPYCDGQIQVYHDIMGLYDEMIPRHSKRYGDLGHQIQNMLMEYKEDVEAKKFPFEEHYTTTQSHSQ